MQLFAFTTAEEVANKGDLWCSYPKGIQSEEYLKILKNNQLSNQISFRGEYRDFDLFVDSTSGDIKDCVAFKPHLFLGDGLWVIEEPTLESFEKTKNKLKAASLPIYYESGYSMVVGGGEKVPDVSGLDGCGADEYTSVIPVPGHNVVVPQISNSRRSEWTSKGLQLNDDVVAGVAAVSMDSLINSVTALQNFNTRNSYSETIYAAQDYLVERLEALGFGVELHSFRVDMAPNVVATWPQGSSYGEWIVAGAHYDSRSTNSSSTTDRAPGNQRTLYNKVYT